jgi:hypothetical protein
MTASLKIKDRKHIDLLKLLNKRRSHVNAQNGGGLISYIKHKFFMRKFNKVVNKINKQAIPLEKLEDQGKERYVNLQGIINNIAKIFNSVIDERKIREILLIRSKEDTKEGDEADKHIVERNLLSVGQSLKTYDNELYHNMAEIDSQIEKYNEYLEKLQKHSESFKESIEDSELLLEKQAEIKVKLDIEARTAEIYEVSKEGKQLKREITNYKNDYDKIIKYSAQFKQEKSDILDKLLVLEKLSSDIIKYYKTLIIDQKQNVRNFDFWREYIVEFYKIISSVKFKDLIDGIDRIINNVNSLISIYKRADEVKLNTEYVIFFEDYKTLLIKSRDEYLKNVNLEITAIKMEYFKNTLVIPISKIKTRVDNVIYLTERVIKILWKFSTFLKYYKNSKFNEILKDLFNKREENITYPDDSSQKGGAKTIREEWGAFINEMSDIIDEPVKGTDNKIRIINSINDKLVNKKERYNMENFNNTYYKIDSKIRNHIGYFKRNSDSETKFTYFNRYNESNETFEASVNKFEIDLANPKLSNITDLDKPALIELVSIGGNLYLFYAGKILQRNGELMDTEASNYMFFCNNFNNNKDDDLNENSKFLLLDAFTGYPVINLKSDHLALLDANFMFEVVYNNKIIKIPEDATEARKAQIRKTFIDKAQKDLAEPYFTKGYGNLQFTHQYYSTIINPYSTSPFKINILKDNRIHHGTKIFEQSEFNNWKEHLKAYIPSISKIDSYDNSESITKTKKDHKNMNEDQIKAEILSQNKDFLQDVLLNPSFVIDIDYDLRTFNEIDSVEEFEKVILKQILTLFEASKASSKSKRKSTSGRKKPSEFINKSLMDNLNLLRSILDKLLKIEDKIKEFKDKNDAELKLLEWDLAKSKERRLEQMNPELSAKIEELIKTVPDKDVLEKTLAKSSIQDRFETYMTKNISPNADSSAYELKANFKDIIEAIKKFTDGQLTAFINLNFLGDSPTATKFGSALLPYFLNRFVAAIGAARSLTPLDKPWFDKEGIKGDFLQYLILETVQKIKGANKKKDGPQQFIPVFGGRILTIKRRRLNRNRQHSKNKNHKKP